VQLIKYFSLSFEFKTKILNLNLVYMLIYFLKSIYSNLI